MASKIVAAEGTQKEYGRKTVCLPRALCGFGIQVNMAAHPNKKVKTPTELYAKQHARQVFAPTAQPIPAWGNAPGHRSRKVQGLKARSIDALSGDIGPHRSGFQPSKFYLNIPGALPQADMGRADGA